jgi:general secretion pathway protein E
MNGKASILIVDDDADMRETLSDILEDKGYNVVIARDGSRAVAEAGMRHFDLALIDIMMPGMNGIETLREIKRANSGITTMIMTGHSALEGMVSDALKAGVDGVLYKPFEIDAIVQMIETKSEARAGPALIDLKKYRVEPRALRLIPEATARRCNLMPLRIEGDTLVVAMADPDDLYAIEDIRALSRMEIKVLRAALMDIRGAINLQYRAASEIEREIGRIPTVSDEVRPEERITSDHVAQAAVVRTVDLLVTQAVRDRASDVHIEPQQDHSRIRYRIDGILHDSLTLPLSVHRRLVSRVKVLAKIDIAERRRPQDGQFTLEVDDREIDVRVATAPTPWGEVAVLRVLDKGMSIMDLSELGFFPETLEVYQQLIRAPLGMILVSGPTGSGKTTTLYATISQLNAEERSIITIEDPIEYHFPDMKQIQVDPQVELTLANGLRAVMRLDPDVILVGEIHDAETARIATQAALTGHLVLTSVHANDAVGVLFRLIELGVEPFLITASVVGVVAQRLVRRICPHCLGLREASDEERLAYEQEMGETRTQFYAGAGCNFCGSSGYLGRTGVFEVLVMSDEIKNLLMRGATADEIKAQAVKEGMVTLHHAAMWTAKQDRTTPAEVLRNFLFVTKHAH